MRKFVGQLARNFALGSLAASPLFSSAAFAQESPAIEAFIAGIENYDEKRVVTPPVEGNLKLPANVLPGNELPAGDGDVVVGSPLVPPQRQSSSPETLNKSFSETVEAPPTPEATSLSPSSCSSSSCSASKEPAPVTQPMPTHLGGTVILGEHDYFESGWASQVIEPAVTARWMLGVSVPLMRRDLDDDRMFSFNPADPAQMLRNRDAQPGDAIGLGLTLSRRNSLGRGWEAGYWGLSAAQSVARLDGGPDTGLQGLSSISDGGVTVADTFNAADSHTLGRDYTLHNFELNRLRNGGVRRPLNRCMTVEWLSGLRFLRFDEQLQYAAIAPANPVVRSELDSTVQNTLFGAQIGGRTEWHLLRRFSLTMGGKIGLFNNRSNNTLTARNRDAGGASSTPQINNGPNAGDPFMFDRQKDDLAVVGEYEFGGLYRLSMRSRIKAGYRVLGVDGIADAEQNIPADFNDVTRLRTIDNHGDLVLRGAFVGVEWVR